MKKSLSVALAVILTIAMLIPANAAGQTYMIFACETDDGCGTHASGFGVLWGPVAQNADLGHPASVQGDMSYCICTTTNQAVVFHNMTHNVGVTTTGTFNATNYDYIELDIYCSQDIICDWDFGLCTSEADPTGASWQLSNAWIPAGRWYHIKMPIAEFGAFDPSFGGSMSNINRIKMQLKAICDTNTMMDTGDFVAPLYTYIYFDNVVATTEGAGSDSELIDLETLMVNPPSWYDQYLEDLESSEPPPPPPAVIYGDVNGDETVSSADALASLQHAVGKTTLEDVAFTAADVNGDVAVDSKDSLLILQYAVGKTSSFPVESN